MGTRLGELLFPLIHRVLTKSLPFITARIQKSNWVRVWGTGGNVMNILTAVSGIAPAGDTFAYTAISRKVVGKSARDNPERYYG